MWNGAKTGTVQVRGIFNVEQDWSKMEQCRSEQISVSGTEVWGCEACFTEAGTEKIWMKDGKRILFIHLCSRCVAKKELFDELAKTGMIRS